MIAEAHAPRADAPVGGMYHLCVPTLANSLRALRGVLDKAAAFAAERGLTDEQLLSVRLYPDMFAVTRQVQIACDIAKGGGARLGGVEVPAFPDEETTVEDLKARIEKTVAFLEGLDPAGFAGAETRTITIPMRDGAKHMHGADYLRAWVFPNVYFHIATAYGLLRSLGVPCGKGDFLGEMPFA